MAIRVEIEPRLCDLERNDTSLLCLLTTHVRAPICASLLRRARHWTPEHRPIYDCGEISFFNGRARHYSTLRTKSSHRYSLHSNNSTNEFVNFWIRFEKYDIDVRLVYIYIYIDIRMRRNSSGSGSRHRDVRMYRVHGR